MTLKPRLLIATLTVAALTLTGTASAEVVRQDATETNRTTSYPHNWRSGAAGDTATDRSFDAWRGTRAKSISTWHDTGFEAMTEQWFLAPGGDLANWQGLIDNAIGAFEADGSWQQAAAGAYDAQWTEALKVMRQYRQGDKGPMVIRFAHEHNGNWMDWSVYPGDEDDYVAAYRRFWRLAEQHYPEALISWAVNDGTTSGIDVRDTWPGRKYVDVITVDTYNQYEHVTTPAQFEAKINATGANGQPRGIQTWLDYAAEKRRPMGISEWSNAANDGGGGGGESPVYMEQMHQWFTDHGSRKRKAGTLWFEQCFCAISGYGPGNMFQLYPQTDQPQTAARYRELW